MQRSMTTTRKGVGAIVLACVIWGFVPLYYKLLAHVPPIEVLSHRTLWSFLFFAAVLAWGKRLSEVRAALLCKSDLVFLAGSASLIALNWFFFIYAVQTDQTTEASLGYFIMPLVSVGFGVLIFREALSKMSWLAVALAGVAVVVLTYGVGQLPWIALILSTSFSLYAVIKKRLSVAPMVSVTVEVLLLVPVALLVMGSFHMEQQGAFGMDVKTTLLLMLSGPLTALPLILFSYGTQTVALSTAGILQYINPSLQFVCATIIFAEPLSQWHFVSFPLIWCALVLYSLSGFYENRLSK